MLAEERGGYPCRSRPLVHDGLGQPARKHRPARHAQLNCVAIAPTATISNIIGVDASIEPCFGNLSVKSNLSGEFTVVNEYLVRDLKKPGPVGRRDGHGPKHFDGSLRRIDRVPEDIKALYATAFESSRVAGRGRRAPPEVDRPGAVAEHLHGRRLGQEARRNLQAGVAARPQDHLLPAHHRATHAEKSTVTLRRAAQRGAPRRAVAAGRRIRSPAAAARG